MFSVTSRWLRAESGVRLTWFGKCGIVLVSFPWDHVTETLRYPSGWRLIYRRTAGRRMRLKHARFHAPELFSRILRGGAQTFPQRSQKRGQWGACAHFCAFVEGSEEAGRSRRRTRSSHRTTPMWVPFVSRTAAIGRRAERILRMRIGAGSEASARRMRR